VNGGDENVLRFLFELFFSGDFQFVDARHQILLVFFLDFFDEEILRLFFGEPRDVLQFVFALFFQRDRFVLEMLDVFEFVFEFFAGLIDVGLAFVEKFLLFNETLLGFFQFVLQFAGLALRFFDRFFSLFLGVFDDFVCLFLCIKQFALDFKLD
jgi:hypothetical protein